MIDQLFFITKAVHIKVKEVASSLNYAIIKTKVVRSSCNSRFFRIAAAIIANQFEVFPASDSINASNENFMKVLTCHKNLWRTWVYVEYSQRSQQLLFCLRRAVEGCQHVSRDYHLLHQPPLLKLHIGQQTDTCDITWILSIRTKMPQTGASQEKFTNMKLAI